MPHKFLSPRINSTIQSTRSRQTKNFDSITPAGNSFHTERLRDLVKNSRRP
jgi:hypothetical protein